MIGNILSLTKKSSATYYAKVDGKLVSGKVVLQGPFSFSRAEREVKKSEPRARNVRFSSIQSPS